MFRVNQYHRLYDYICTGTSSRHVMSIADHVVQSSRAAGMPPLSVEGENAADWIVVDLGDVIVRCHAGRKVAACMNWKTLELMREAATCRCRHEDARLFKRDLRNIPASFSEKICPLERLKSLRANAARTRISNASSTRGRADAGRRR